MNKASLPGNGRRVQSLRATAATNFLSHEADSVVKHLEAYSEEVQTNGYVVVTATTAFLQLIYWTWGTVIPKRLRAVVSGKSEPTVPVSNSKAK